MATKERSPNYPQISLPEAIELARKFFAAEGRTAVDQETAAKAMGYGSMSGASRTKVGALKQYNLLQGRGDTITITALGVRIIHPDDEGDYAAAIREAVEAPHVFASLLETHAEASENAIVAYLVKSKGFTPDGARQAAKSFKDSLSFAKLSAAGGHEDSSRENNSGKSEAGSSPAAPFKPQPSPVPIMPAGVVQRSFTTGTDTMDAVITITSHSGDITADDIAFLKDYLDFLGRSWSRRKPQRQYQPQVEPAGSSLGASAVSDSYASTRASLPIMITKQMESDLRAAGYSIDEINRMTPQQAHDSLAARGHAK